MNKIWVGTNWKMTKTIKEGKTYTKDLIEVSKNISSNINLFIIPSYTALIPVRELVKESNVLMGAQNMHWEDAGPYTGEISPRMLEEVGVDLIELGHSERRQYYNEGDIDVNKKVLAALAYQIKPLICIGENKAEKELGISKERLASQLKVCLKDVTSEQTKELLIAYEPVWAIGEHGEIADSNYIAEIHAFLRKILVELFGEAGGDIPLLYGGSVNQANYMEYIQIPDVNGLFIGRSAWDIKTFKIMLDKLTNYAE